MAHYHLITTPSHYYIHYFLFTAITAETKMWPHYYHYYHYYQSGTKPHYSLLLIGAITSQYSDPILQIAECAQSAQQHSNISR